MYLETVTGKKVNPVNILAEQLDMEDIAWALSRINRFAGHTITLIPYNVADHSIFVKNMIYEDTGNALLALYGLLHDAAEAYIGDIPSPVKHNSYIEEGIARIEKNVLEAVYDKFVSRFPTDEEMETVKYYDKKAQKIEAHAFMFSRGKDWGFKNIEVELVEFQRFHPPRNSLESYMLFKHEYYETRKLLDK
jgi:hypothetical protein